MGKRTRQILLKQFDDHVISKQIETVCLLYRIYSTIDACAEREY